MKTKLCVFDIEVLKNVFICCTGIPGQKIITFEISPRKFQLHEMVEYFVTSGHRFVGYNCTHYDTPIMNMLIDRRWEFEASQDYQLVCGAASALSSLIINDKDGRDPRHTQYKWRRHFKDLDLMTLMASKNLRVPLKSLQVTMCYPNVKEMTVNWEKPLPVEDIAPLISYCHNDVGSTTELCRLLKNDISLRMAIQQEFHIECLSKDGVGIGVDIFTKRICDKLGLRNEKDLFHLRKNVESVRVRDFIPSFIEFKTPAAQRVMDFYTDMELDSEGLNWFGEDPEKVSAANPKKKTSIITRIGNLRHSFGIGGVHSINTPKVYKECEKMMIRDADVASLYPSLAIEYLFGPAGFLLAFLAVLIDLREDRLIAKKNKDKLKDTTYKLALNSILGNLRNRFSPYYAPEANTGICVSGQLMLLMLIEELELNGIEVISSNTDGVTCYFDRSKEELYNKICKEWEAKTKLVLEYVDYEKLVIVAVNDYVAYKKGYSDVKDQLTFDNADEAVEFNFTYPRLKGEANTIKKNEYVKEKGMFITNPRLGKGLDCLIISKALIEYFGKGTPIRDTITQSTDIWDFIKFQKIGKQYDVYWKGEKQQHINRFYVSKKGGYLYKTKMVDKYDPKTNKDIRLKSEQNVLKGFGVQLFNEYERLPMEAYGIDYRYYVSQANKIIHLLEPQQSTLF